VVARHLLTSGYRVKVVLVGRSRDISHEATLQNWLALQAFQAKISIIEVSDSSSIPDAAADVVVDALWELGLKENLNLR